jgi:hypothetical protein
LGRFRLYPDPDFSLSLHAKSVYAVLSAQLAAFAARFQTAFHHLRHEVALDAA